LGGKIPSLRSFLTSLKISEDSVFQLTEIIRKIDESREIGTYLTREQIEDFIIRRIGFFLVWVVFRLFALFIIYFSINKYNYTKH
jgi:hypothetical protein